MGRFLFYEVIKILANPANSIILAKKYILGKKKARSRLTGASSVESRGIEVF